MIRNTKSVIRLNTDPKWKEIQVSRPAVGPKQAPSQCLPNHPFRGLNWPSLEADDLAPSSS